MAIGAPSTVLNHEGGSGRDTEKIVWMQRSDNIQGEDFKGKITGIQMNGPTRIVIEWRHIEFGDIPCGRCTDTGTNLLNVVSELDKEHLLEGVELEIQNTILHPEQIEESNVVLINGVPVEKILNTGVMFPGCSGCLESKHESGHFHSAAPARDVFKGIPVEVLREAILKVLKGN
jgi:hypothetical protein